jgi:hypothetical protein
MVALIHGCISHKVKEELEIARKKITGETKSIESWHKNTIIIHEAEEEEPERKNQTVKTVNTLSRDTPATSRDQFQLFKILTPIEI